MKLFACYNQIFLRNVLRDYICALYRACNFDHIKRIFNSNERRILIDLFSLIFLISNSINSCLLIFAIYYILYLLLLHQLNFCLFLFKEFR